MKNNNHTQGEWQYENDLNHSIFVQTNEKYNKGKIYVTGYVSGEANARLIVKAVNNHNKLIEALKSISVFAEKGLTLWAENKEVDFKNLAGFIYEKAKEAIQSIEHQ